MSKRTDKQYRTANEAEADIVMKRAASWYFNENPADMFGSMASVVKLAIAEYIANQNELTLYEITPYEEPQDD